MADQLTALDATFLELEQMDEGATMHIGSVMIFETPPNGVCPTLAEVRESIASRLTKLPRYSQKLSSERTGGLSWPRWQDDPQFDVADHIQRAALPSPGGEAELMEWTSDFFSHRLDRTRPLWEMVLLEGLHGGRWALAAKTHHCLVDGVGSVGVVHLLLDLEPTASPRHAPERPETPTTAAALPWSLHAPEALGDLARSGVRAARAGVHAALHPGETLERSRSLVELIVRDEVIGAPETSINVPIGANRRFEVVRADLGELKAIGHLLGGSVNDVILAACTSGLRTLFMSRSEDPPEQGLRAMVPMNIRQGSEQLALGNRISSLFVTLPVGDPDAFSRLRRIVEHTGALKSSGAALGAATMIDLASMAPPVLHASVARSLYATRLFNLTITNVPGPRVPLYAFGAPLVEALPIVPLAAHHAIGIAIVSYGGQLAVGISADRDSTHDLDVLACGIETGFDELRGLLADATLAEAHSSNGDIPRLAAPSPG
jgi:diacylglycerol O-acyltransferase / wax synthase